MADGRRRLLLLINSLEGGGAENVIAQLAGGLARQLSAVDIRLALLDDLPAVHPVDAAVEVVRLDSRGSYFRSIAETRRLVAAWRPDVVLSFLTRANCAAVLARGKARFRCVISERVNTTSHLGHGLRGRLLRLVVAGLYPRADAVVAVSDGVRDALWRGYRVPAERLTVIHNPVDIEIIRARAAEPPAMSLPEDFLVSVGRLVPNKAGAVLLHAFAAQRNKDRALVMLGEGPERKALAALAEELGVAHRVLMPGFVDNPHAVVGRATAFVSASRSEGFPNAMVEAMALARPVIATDCPSGPAEILAERQSAAACGLDEATWGLLVPVDDTGALALAMDLVDDPARRRHYASRAAQRAESYAARPAVEAYARAMGF